MIPIEADALAEPGPNSFQDVSGETLAAQFTSLLNLPGTDPEVLDIVAMLHGALTSAQQTGQWELLADAVGFAHGRLGVRGLTDAGFADIGTALVSAASARLTATERDRLSDLLAPVEEPGPLTEDQGGMTAQAAAYLGHVLDGDRTGAVELTRRCVTEGMAASEVLLDILEPAQREVGRLWADGLISVIQEHFCTAVTQFVMTDLYPGIVEAQESGRRLVAVHAHDSLHHVGLRMVADVLECRGWGTSYVGDDISVEALIALLAEDRSHLLLIGASMSGQIPHVTALIRAVRNDPRTRGVKVAVGGRPFLIAPELVNAVGADGWARDARDAIDVCDQLMGAAE